MKLAIYPDPVLRVRTEPFDEDEMDEARSVAREMTELMYKKRGLGLAGPQVGVPRRIFVVDVTEERESPLVLINPKVDKTEGTQKDEEGCLSFPSIFAQVNRAGLVRFSYLDTEGEPQTIEGEGLLARTLQHEFDHLEGVLFIDRLGAAERLAIRKELKEMERAADRAR